MIAEYIIAALLLVFCLGYIVGEQNGRRIERGHARRRMRNLTIGGMRDW